MRLNVRLEAVLCSAWIGNEHANISVTYFSSVIALKQARERQARRIVWLHKGVRLSERLEREKNMRALAQERLGKEKSPPAPIR